jgi:hypothetical protein
LLFYQNTSFSWSPHTTYEPRASSLCSQTGSRYLTFAVVLSYLPLLS